MKKLKILQLNTVYRKGSTGKIVAGIEDVCYKNGLDVYSAYRFHETSNNKDKEIAVSTWIDCHVHNRLSTYTGLQGCFSHFRTRMFIRKLNTIRPDIIHLHNIHGSFVNYKLLFDYIKRRNVKVVWTLHDCWPFTGLCPYFDMYRCEKWKDGCKNCVMCKQEKYPLFDFTKIMWSKKKRMFTNIENMTLVAPSHWLADLTRQSFLKDYPVKVINNGIDLNVFQPIQSDFRTKNGIKENQFMILGVAFGWGKRKGLDVFIQLAKDLDDNYRIVLVGTDDRTDETLPKNIVSIHRTNNQQELAEIYSAADVFVNPTREDNFPTTNLEALACGTPVITFNTGGSPEALDEKCGIVVECDDVEGLEKAIHHVCEDKPFKSEDCRKRAECFDMNDKFQKYVELYNEVDK